MPSVIARIVSAASVWLCLALAACGGKGDAQPAVPTVTQILPATGILPDLNDGPAMVLNVPIDETTATRETVSLQSPVGAVSGTVAVEGNRVSFQPTQRLVWGTNYTMQLAPPLAGVGGTRLAGPVAQVFRTPVATWSAPAAVDSAKGIGSPSSQAGMDERGNVFRLTSNDVSNSSDPSTPQFVVSRFDAASGTWSEPMLLAPKGMPSVLKVDPQGNAFVVWLSDLPKTGQPIDIMASRYDVKSATWSAPVVLRHYDAVASPGSGAPYVPIGYSPTLEVDQSGNALVVWNVKIPGSYYRVQFTALHYDVKAGTWEPAIDVATVDGLGRWSLSMAPDGNAMLGWTEGFPGGTDGFYITERKARATIFNVSTQTWGTPDTVGEINNEFASPSSRLPCLATGLSSEAAICWSDHNVLHIAKYSPVRAAWNTDTASTNFYGTADLKFDNNGDAVLVMSTRAVGQTSRFSVRKSPRDTDSWNEIGSIPLAPDDAFPTPRIAVDPADNLIITYATYAQGSVDDKMPAVRYVKKTGILQSYPALAIPWKNSLLSTKTDAAGNLILLYAVPNPSNSGHDNIYAVRYNASEDKWESPVLVNSDPSLVLGGELLVTNSVGEAMVFWLEEVGKDPLPNGFARPISALYFSRLGR